VTTAPLPIAVALVIPAVPFDEAPINVLLLSDVLETPAKTGRRLI